MDVQHDSSLNADITLRLQQIISNWGGAGRGEPLSMLHSQCVDAVGRGNTLLPAQLLFVSDLDLTHLRTAFKRSTGINRNTTIEFRVAPSGRFDTAVVPVGRAGAFPDRFVLAIDDALSIQDQVALYGHAVGHLLLNYQEQQLGQRPQLDPRNAFAHADTIAELRLLEAVRQPLDRRVLETFPLLTRLLEPPEESVAAFDAATLGLRDLLTKVGWVGQQHLQMHHQLTAGRVYPSSSRRGTRLYVDALLRASVSLPIAVVLNEQPKQERMPFVVSRAMLAVWRSLLPTFLMNKGRSRSSIGQSLQNPSAQCFLRFQDMKRFGIAGRRLSKLLIPDTSERFSLPIDIAEAADLAIIRKQLLIVQSLPYSNLSRASAPLVSC